MKLGFVSDSLGGMSFEDMIDNAARMGVDGVEVNTGGWSAAPHFDLACDEGKRRGSPRLREGVQRPGARDRQLSTRTPILCTLDDPAQDACLRDTIVVAGEMGITGPSARCPACPRAARPTPCRTGSSLPGLRKPRTILRVPVGRCSPAVLDRNRRPGQEPTASRGSLSSCTATSASTTFLRCSSCAKRWGRWSEPTSIPPICSGWGPIRWIAAEALGDAIYHVHAKDTMLNAPVQATTSLLENGGLAHVPSRSWSYVTLGYGHGEEWWRKFCFRLKMAGYDGWLSIEHEDVMINSLEGLEKSVALLKCVMPAAVHLTTNCRPSADGRHALRGKRQSNARVTRRAAFSLTEWRCIYLGSVIRRLRLDLAPGGRIRRMRRSSRDIAFIRQ